MHFRALLISLDRKLACWYLPKPRILFILYISIKGARMPTVSPSRTPGSIAEISSRDSLIVDLRNGGPTRALRLYDMHSSKQCGEPGCLVCLVARVCPVPGFHEHLETHFLIRSSCRLRKGADFKREHRASSLASSIHSPSQTLSIRTQLTSQNGGECHRPPISVPGMGPAARSCRSIRPISACRTFGIKYSI